MVIKKDVNKVLLFLVIIPIILFISFSTYYENKLKNITIEHNKSKKVTGKAVFEQANETMQLKETFQRDKEFFENKYSELNTENENLKTEKDRLQSGLNSAKSELENLNDKFSRLQSQFQQVQNSLIHTNEQISRLLAKNNELCNKLKSKDSSEKC